MLLLRWVNHLAHIAFACSSYSCFAPSPPFPLDALRKVSAHFSTEVLSVMVPGGCHSQGFHGYFLGSLVAPFGFTRHLPHTHLQCMSIGLMISYKKCSILVVGLLWPWNKHEWFAVHVLLNEWSVFFSKVVELAWNVDSTVLAVWAVELQSQDLPESQFVPKSYGKFKSHYSRIQYNSIHSFILCSPLCLIFPLCPFWKIKHTWMPLEKKILRRNCPVVLGLAGQNGFRVNYQYTKIEFCGIWVLPL